MSCKHPISKLWIPDDILKEDYPILLKRRAQP